MSWIERRQDVVEENNTAAPEDLPTTSPAPSTYLQHPPYQPNPTICNFNLINNHTPPTPPIHSFYPQPT